MLFCGFGGTEFVLGLFGELNILLGGRIDAEVAATGNAYISPSLEVDAGEGGIFTGLKGEIAPCIGSKTLDAFLAGEAVGFLAVEGVASDLGGFVNGLGAAVGEGKDFGVAAGLKGNVAPGLGFAAFDAKVGSCCKTEVAPGAELASLPGGVFCRKGSGFAPPHAELGVFLGGDAEFVAGLGGKVAAGAQVCVVEGDVVTGQEGKVLPSLEQGTFRAFGLMDKVALHVQVEVLQGKDLTAVGEVLGGIEADLPTLHMAAVFQGIATDVEQFAPDDGALVVEVAGELKVDFTASQEAAGAIQVAGLYTYVHLGDQDTGGAAIG